jgi:hypothetical protein
VLLAALDASRRGPSRAVSRCFHPTAEPDVAPSSPRSAPYQYPEPPELEPPELVGTEAVIT